MSYIVCVQIQDIVCDSTCICPIAAALSGGIIAAIVVVVLVGVVFPVFLVLIVGLVALVMKRKRKNK